MNILCPERANTLRTITYRALACLLALLLSQSVFAVVPQKYLGRPEPAGFTIESMTKVINSGKYTGLDLAQRYWERGMHYVKLKQHLNAIQDFTEAVTLNGKYTEAYLQRAISFARIEQYEEAYADLKLVERLEPTSLVLYSTRGSMSFYLGHYAEAAADFEHYLQLKPNDNYRWIWWYMSEYHINKQAGLKLAKVRDKSDLTQWPWPIIMLFLGELTVENIEQALTKHVKDTDPRLFCEAFFYIGQYYLLQGNAAEARRYFEAALKTGAERYLEYEFSAAYLKHTP